MNQCPKTTATIDAARKKSIERSREGGVARTSASTSGPVTAGRAWTLGGLRGRARACERCAVRGDPHDAVFDMHRGGLRHPPGHDENSAQVLPFQPHPAGEGRDRDQRAGLRPNLHPDQATLERALVACCESGGTPGPTASVARSATAPRGPVDAPGSRTTGRTSRWRRPSPPVRRRRSRSLAHPSRSTRRRRGPARRATSRAPPRGSSGASVHVTKQDLERRRSPWVTTRRSPVGGLPRPHPSSRGYPWL